MGRPGPKKTQAYGVEFKRAAVQLCHRPGIQVQAVAEALDINPYMLSRRRKEFREGRLRPQGLKPEPRARKAPREIEVGRLQEEHALLKQAIRFCPEQRLMRHSHGWSCLGHEGS